MFSVKSKFNPHGSDGKLYVRRRSGEEFHQECLVSKVKYPESQMIPECIYSAKELVGGTL